MTVYVVSARYENEPIQGVFSTRELAEQYLNGSGLAQIEEHDIDNLVGWKYRKLHRVAIRLFSGEEVRLSSDLMDGPPCDSGYTNWMRLEYFRSDQRNMPFFCEQIICMAQSTISREAALDLCRQNRKKILAAEPIDGNPSGFRLIEKPGHGRPAILLGGTETGQFLRAGFRSCQYLNFLLEDGWALSDPIPYSKYIHDILVTTGWGVPSKVPDFPTT